MVARRRRFFDPATVYTEEDVEKETADLTAIVRAFQAGARLGPLPEPTPREREVLQLLANDQDTYAVAEQLTISRDTVRSHLENLRLKYHRRTVQGLVGLALRNGWIQ
jgi:DNA-binding CsgD family transcriptional regulator